MNYRLLKSEPSVYSRNDLVKDGKWTRDGVRNYQARNNLAAMKKWDLWFFYHSNEWKEIVGICRIIRENYPDPTIDDDRRVAVDIEPVGLLSKSVTLSDIKANPKLSKMKLVTHSRLSVIDLTKKDFNEILKMSQNIK